MANYSIITHALLHVLLAFIAMVRLVSYALPIAPLVIMLVIVLRVYLQMLFQAMLVWLLVLLIAQEDRLALSSCVCLVVWAALSALLQHIAQFVFQVCSIKVLTPPTDIVFLHVLQVSIITCSKVVLHLVQVDTQSLEEHARQMLKTILIRIHFLLLFQLLHRELFLFRSP